jgi:hypothetical protein
MQTFEVTISKQNIIAEVRNETHKFGKGRDNGALTPQQVSNLQADDLSQDTSIVETAYKSALERAVSALSKHIDGLGSAEEGAVTITFKMSRYYSPLSNASVESGIHDFVKAMTMYGYLKLVAPNDAAMYYREAENKLTEVKSALNYKKWRSQSA